MKTPPAIKAIARAVMRPCPPLRPARVAVRLSDGYEYSPYGAHPWPSRIETRGVCYYDERENTYYGKRYASEHAARRAWNYYQLRNAVRFVRQLRTLRPADLKAQADYWLAK